ncbi:hypothetical protein ACHAXM_011210 [Skeletonema potamos]
MRVNKLSSPLVLLAALFALLLLPSAARQDIQMRLALDYDDIVRLDLDSVDKILTNVMSFLANAKGRPKPNKQNEMKLMLSDLRSQIEAQIDQLGYGGEIQIFYPLQYVQELYDDENAVWIDADHIVIKPDSQPPPSPPGYKKYKKWAYNEQSALIETKRDTSPYATVIDHDAILQSLGWENAIFADYPSYCDSNTKEILPPLLGRLNLPNSFRRYNCDRIMQDLKHHRLTGRWSERAVLEEFFFAVTGIPPGEEERLKSVGLVASGKWLSDVNHCDWDGITCGSTTVGPGARGMMEEEDDDDANCAVVAGVKTCKVKKTRCDGKIDVDQFLNIPCPPKTSVTKIDLTSISYLSGTLISNLYMLTNLHRLNLMKNQIHGTLPASFSEFKKLEFLDVSNNQMTSQLPPNLPSTLEEVWFENNAFTGSLPDDFGRLKDLRFIDISNNQITGTIPFYFSEMTRLNSLALASNKLTGSIPDFELPGLDVLDFSDNKLTEMPNIFPPNLSELKLGSNQLKGPFPNSNLPVTLSVLNVTGNNFTGVVPTQLDLDDDESYLNLWRSFGCDERTLCQPGHDILCSPGYFSPAGAVSELGPCQVCPMSEDELKKKMLGQTTCSSKDYIAGDINGDGVLSEREIMQLFYVFTNGREWGGDFLKDWENVNAKTCDLPGVSCNGDRNVVAITPNNAILCAGSRNCHGLPSELGLLKSLQIIGLSGASKLKGTLPSELGKLDNLNVLKLDKCSSLTGSIPTQFGNLKSLKILDLSNSGFSGSLPSELGQLSGLTTLNLSLNSFSGSIPSTISDISSLKQLILSRCKLNGRIPANIQNLHQLENLELYGNYLTGPFPDNLSGLVSLKRLDVFSNQLTSTLPSELGLLKNLQIIHTKENQLSGSLPSGIALLPSLTWLDLSNNNITGTIDPAYGMSSSLVDLKLGGNIIHGPIPDTVCTAKKLHDGMTSKYGCDAILRPLGTYCTSGYATPTSECKPCPSGQSSLHLGASSCVTISQREILAMFFDVMGGQSWDEDQRRGWKTLPNECDWSGVSCDSNGELNTLAFQMR